VKISFELRVSCSQMDAYVACCVVDLLRDGFSSAVRSVAISDGCEFVCKGSAKCSWTSQCGEIGMSSS